MYRLLFLNRWAAAAWVALMLVSVLAFFGEGGGQAQIDKAAAMIREGRQPKVLPPLPVAVPETIEEAVEEEELVDEDAASAAKKAQSPALPAEDEDADIYIVIDKSTPIQAATDEELAPAM